MCPRAALAFGRRIGLPEKTLRQADTRRVEIAALEQVDLAALQEQRNEGTSPTGWVEGFDRRGIEAFELFRSEFGQNSGNYVRSHQEFQKKIMDVQHFSGAGG